jgi:hypothetical protein
VVVVAVVVAIAVAAGVVAVAVLASGAATIAAIPSAVHPIAIVRALRAPSSRSIAALLEKLAATCSRLPVSSSPEEGKT